MLYAFILSVAIACPTHYVKIESSFWDPQNEAHFFQEPQPLDSGTACQIYLKRGIISKDTKDTTHMFYGTPDPEYEIDTTNNVHNIWRTFCLPDDENPADHINAKTIIWTTCPYDSFLIDQVKVYAADGSATFGSNDNYGWCLSTTADDNEMWNTHADAEYGGINAYHPFADQAFSTIFFKDGAVWGWHGWAYKQWQCNHMGDTWEDYFTGQDQGVDCPTMRRFLAEQESVPSRQDVIDCRADPSRPEDECTKLVDEILEFRDSHPEGWQLLWTVDGGDEQNFSEDDNSQDEEQNSSQDDSGRRRLFELLQKFQ